jgi:hypothetical protein
MMISAARLALAALLLLFAGCFGEPRGYTQQDLQSRCLMTGGVWHPSAVRDGFCEYQSPGFL